jgi:hypothetical protein
MIEFKNRLKILFFVMGFYYYLCLLYTPEFMSVIVSGLNKNFELEFIYSMIIELHEIMLNVINHTVLLFLIPFIVNEFVIYFKPALYDKEKLFAYGMAIVVVVTFTVNMLVSFWLLDCFMQYYILQSLGFFKLTGVKAMPDFKFMIIQVLSYIKHSMYTFIWYNIGVIYFLKFFNKDLNIKLNIRLSNFVLFLYLYLIGCFMIDSLIQLMYFYGTQVIELEFLIFAEFFFMHQLYHDKELEEVI